MARTRTPTAVLELRGAFKRHPERKRERDGEPIPTTALGEPRADLTAAEKIAWREMSVEGFWLTGADRFMLEVAAGLLAQHRRGTIDNPARSLLISTLAKLGFGPTERSKIKAPDGKKEPSPFEQFK